MDGEEGRRVSERRLQSSERLVGVGGDRLEDGLLHRMSRWRRGCHRNQPYLLWFSRRLVEVSGPQKIRRRGRARKSRPPFR